MWSYNKQVFQFPILNKIQLLIDYLKLVKEEQYKESYKIHPKDFIGPSSYTLTNAKYYFS